MSTDVSTDFFLPADLVARALANLAEREHDAIDQLSRQSDQGEPSVKEELSFRLRDYNAFIKAGYEWGKGKRPIMTPNGSWLVPSRTTGGVIYEVAQREGYWHCGPNCKAQQFHWHTALVLGIERAMELADEEDDGDSDACPICDGAGCSECDGTPLTDDEIADQIGGPGTADAWHEHEAEQQLWTRLARARAAAADIADLWAA